MNPKALLAEQIERYFNLSEVQDLCFRLDVNFENLAGSTLSDKCRELVQYCERARLLDDLLDQLRQMRPDIPWTTTTPQPGRKMAAAATPPPSRRWLLPLLLLTFAAAALTWQFWPASTKTDEDYPLAPTTAPPSSTQSETEPARAVSSPRPAGITGAVDPAAFPTDTPFLAVVTENLLIASPGRTTYPSLLADPNGGLHLAWWDNTARNGGANGDIFYRYQPAGGSWGAIEQLTDDSFEYISQYSIQIRLRPDGAICLFFTDGQLGLNQSCRIDDAWGPIEALRGHRLRDSLVEFDRSGQAHYVTWQPADGIVFGDTELGKGLTGGYNPRFAIDTDNNFHVAWFASENGPYRIMHRVSTDDGTNWAEPQIVPMEETPANPFILHTNNDGGVDLIWKGYAGGFYYQTWTAAGSWSAAETLPGNIRNSCTSVDLQQAPEGDRYFTWQNDEGVFVSRRPVGEDQAWSTPAHISSRRCRDFGPLLAVLPAGRLVAVYSDGDDVQYDLYQAELQEP